MLDIRKPKTLPFVHTAGLLPPHAPPLFPPAPDNQYDIPLAAE